MMPIKIILLVTFLLITIGVVQLLRNRLLSRILIIVLAVAAVYFILMPDQLTAIATLLGVGRGTDLLVYLGFCGLLMLHLLSYRKTKKLEEQVAELNRKIALKEAEKDEDC
jgi:hypothetical protein